jgi:hypothetical protein
LGSDREGSTAVGGITRRRLLVDAGTAVAGTALIGTYGNGSAFARPGRRPTVAVFGGGIAGLTAAHELADRGFVVSLYERRAWGGKARSFGVPGTDSGGRASLPGEHSPYVVLGSYQNLPDTLRRIPAGSNPNGVFDNVVPAPQLEFARTDHTGFKVWLGDRPPPTPEPDLVVQLATHLTPVEAAYLADRLLVFFTSCDARRLGQWERVSWWDFLGADRFSANYRALVVGSVAKLLAAQDPNRVSSRAAGLLMEGFFGVLLGQIGQWPLFNARTTPLNSRRSSVRGSRT